MLKISAMSSAIIFLVALVTGGNTIPGDKTPKVEPTQFAVVEKLLQSIPKDTLPEDGKWGLVDLTLTNKFLEKYIGTKIKVFAKVEKIVAGFDDDAKQGFFVTTTVEYQNIIFRNQKIQISTTNVNGKYLGRFFVPLTQADKLRGIEPGHKLTYKGEISWFHLATSPTSPLRNCNVHVIPETESLQFPK